VVGVDVMAVVLINPKRVADAEQEVSQGKARDMGPARSSEDLAMADIMAEHLGLDVSSAKKDRAGEHQYNVVEGQGEGNADRKQAQKPEHLEGVETGLTLEESGRNNPAP